MIATVTGCGSDDSNAALDAYVEAERELAAASSDVGTVYTEISIEPDYPAGIVITYSYLEPVDAAEGEAFFGELTGAFEQECTTTIFPAMREAGIEGDLSAEIGFANDGEAAFWSYTCGSS